MNSSSDRSSSSIFVASAISSIVSTVITNPIEVAKLNLQYYPLTCPQYPHSNFRELISCNCSTNFSFEGSLKSLKVALPQVTISNILYMTLYEDRRRSLLEKHQWSATNSTIAATIIARLFVSSVMLPMEVLRVSLSNSVKLEEKKVFNFKGMKATLIRDMAYSALFWLTFENIRNWYVSGDYRQHSREQQSMKSVLQNNIVPSMIAGGLISAITTPLDTVKTRIQSSQSQSSSMLKELVRIYNKEKMMGLFSGVHFRVLKNSVHSSIYMALFQYSLRRMQKSKRE